MKSNTKIVRWWDLTAAVLLLAALLTSATRLLVTQWTDDLAIIQTVTSVGLIAGFALGKSRFNTLWVRLFALIYGIYVIPWQLGMTMNPEISWLDRLLILQSRLEVIFIQILKQQPIRDSLLFLVLMGVLFWFISVHAGYTLVRHGEAWGAILPAGMALFIFQLFDPAVSRRAWYLAIFLFFALVLIARMAYLYHNNRWQRAHTALPPHLGMDFIRIALIATAFFVIFAWSAPVLADSVPAAENVYRKVRGPWMAFRSQFDNLFASLQSSMGYVTDYYGNNLSLGRGNRLADNQVFAVKPPEIRPPGYRFYWRARTYDTYNDGQWLNAYSRVQAYEPQGDQTIKIAQSAGRWEGTFEFAVASPVATLFLPSEPVWASRSALIDAARNPDGSLDLSSIRANPSLKFGDFYRIKSLLSAATVTDLENSGSNYPDWVTARYLQLPQTITPRTIDLARRLTTGLQTPYEKVSVITNFLRKNITYNEIVPNHPNSQETIDWFLFDHKEGFCNYYATAEIILLRAAGIPARMAVGFAQGEQLQNGSYFVRQRDAHAWPEVYFPNLGWITFEPTVSQPEIIIPVGTDQPQEENRTPADSSLEELERQRLEEERQLDRESRRTLSPLEEMGASPTDWKPWVLSLAFLLIVLLSGWWLSRHVRLEQLPVTIEATFIRLGLRPPRMVSQWARWASLPPLTRAYNEINQALKRLGRKPGVTATPAERAAELALILPTASLHAQQLVSEYQVGMFSTQLGNLDTAMHASRAIRSLSFKAMVQRLIQRTLSRVQDPRTTRSKQTGQA
jgi:transglutaminase-like putative cysteine protease